MPLSRRFPPPSLLLAVLLSGCAKPSSPITSPSSPVQSAGIYGRVTAAAQAVSGATIQLYAVGTAGDGTPGTSLLKTAVTADSAGNFNLLDKFTCPSQTTQVVLVATGGNPGDSATSNSALAFLLAVGQCSQLSTSNYFLVNETNTVAAVSALAPFITSPSAIGSSGSDAADLVAAMVTARQFVNVGSGASPGDAPPAGDAVPSQLINTLASVIGTCASSTGGVAGDGSRCGQLFARATPPGGSAPTNTLQALLDITANPTLNTTRLFNLTPATAFFQPTLVTAPANFNIQLIQPAAPTLTPAVGLTFASTARGATSAVQSITLTNSSSTSMPLGVPTLLGASAAAFSLTSSCNTTLQPQASCSLSVTFTPTSTGATSAYILLHSGSATVQYVPLSGSAT